MEDNKVYVDVFVLFSKDGLIIPKRIIWENGVKYDISRVYEIQRLESYKTSMNNVTTYNPGSSIDMSSNECIRYTCLVEGEKVHLYYEGGYMWYLYRKV